MYKARARIFLTLFLGCGFTGIDVCCSTGITSLASSMFRFGYEYENGRRYHSLNEGTYPLPNDEVSIIRICILHKFRP